MARTARASTTVWFAYEQKGQLTMAKVIDTKQVCGCMGIDSIIADPLASPSGQFSLTRPENVSTSEDVPSADGVRPWGMRRMRPTGTAARRALAARYDPLLQMTVDVEGTPLITKMGQQPTADTTSTVDGEDPPSAEDWDNDFDPGDGQPI